MLSYARYALLCCAGYACSAPAGSVPVRAFARTSTGPLLRDRQYVPCPASSSPAGAVARCGAPAALAPAGLACGRAFSARAGPCLEHLLDEGWAPEQELLREGHAPAK